MAQIPFLPGNVFNDPANADRRRPQSLDFVNGYPVRMKSKHSLSDGPSITPESLIESLKAAFPPRQHTKAQGLRFVPAHVIFDKKVLCFDAYFRQILHESREQYLLRKVKIFFYLEDDSISVVEHALPNSGINQGTLIKRHRIPKPDGSNYSVRDFNLGQNVVFYDKTFRLVDCDAFTRKYMLDTERIVLGEPEAIPKDPHQEARKQNLRLPAHEERRNDTLGKFLANDRNVLRFYCTWDDRESVFGEVRDFILHYYLVDDSVEIREIPKPNSGRNASSILLRRQLVPKKYRDLSDILDAAKNHYTWEDFSLGGTVDILGRPFFMRDCDAYTRDFLLKNGRDAEELKPAPEVEAKQWIEIKHEIPPYNGFGSVEDSLGSCKYLVLKPPKKDFVKMLENEHKVLRFLAKLETRYPEDASRRFVISFRLADDMITIYEPPQRNAGILGGKFMERTRPLKPHSSLTDKKPEYYEIKDFTIGNKVIVNKHVFEILDADEYALNYMKEKNLIPKN